MKAINEDASQVADLEAEGEPVPEPPADPTNLGKFTQRLQDDLHRALATEAALEKILLDHLLEQRLDRTTSQ